MTRKGKTLQQKNIDQQTLIKKQPNKIAKLRLQLKKAKSKISVSAKKIKENRKKIQKQKFAQFTKSSSKKHKNKYTLKALSTLKKEKGYFAEYGLTPRVEVNEATIPDIIEVVYEIIEVATKKIKRKKIKLSSNTQTNVRLRFTNSKGKFVNTVNTNKEGVRRVLFNVAHKHSNDPDDPYVLLLAEVAIFLVDLGSKGGCVSRKKIIKNKISQNETVRLISPKSKNNNCLPQAILFACGSKKRAHILKKKRGLDINVMWDYEKDGEWLVDQIKEAKKRGVKIYDLKVKPNRVLYNNLCSTYKTLFEYPKRKTNPINIGLIGEHFYVIENMTYEGVCSKCGQKCKNMMAHHKKGCNPKKLLYYQTTKQKQNWLRGTSLRYDSKKENWVFFDLETFGDLSNHSLCKVYAVGWYDCKENKYYNSYGKNSMKTFIEYVLSHKNKKYMAYNGCRFDFYFLNHHLIQKKITTDFLLNSGRLLALKWGTAGEENEVWDLCNFLNCSLKKGCESFQTKCQKQDFDHNLINNWNDTEKHKKEVLHYLKYDVLSLKELTETFTSTFEDLYSSSPTKYLTLTSCAENIWRQTLECCVELPDAEKLSFIGQSVYGGRTYPRKMEFESSLYKKIMMSKNNEKRKVLYKELLESNDFVYNGDINSQYPASMIGVEGEIELKVKYPVGKSVWIQNPVIAKKKFEAKKCGIFRVKFRAPKNIATPILPRKKKGGGVEWSLLDGEGIYNSIDLENALKFGYKIEFTNESLVWEEHTNNLFTHYINTVYKQKKKATIENNEVNRSIAKLMMNSLYGKMLQNIITDGSVIARSVSDIQKFLKKYTLTDWEISGNKAEKDFVILTGSAIEIKTHSLRPRQLGSFILGYSRRLWLKFIQKVSPKLDRIVCSYLDTDSLHITGKDYKKLVSYGYINETTLGYLSNDCDEKKKNLNNGLIIQEINLAPKCYMYRCLYENGEIKTVMKSKGIMNKHLKEEFFENVKNLSADDKEVEWVGLKKINKRLTKNEKASEIPFFSIQEKKYTRTFYKNPWKGMKLKNGVFHPFQ